MSSNKNLATAIPVTPGLKRARVTVSLVDKSVITPSKSKVSAEPLTMEVKTPPTSPVLKGKEKDIHEDLNPESEEYEDDVCLEDGELDEFIDQDENEPVKKKRTCVNICIVEELLSVLNRTVSSLELQIKQSPNSKNTLAPVLSSLNTHKKIWSDILKTNERSRRRRIRRIEKEKTNDDTVLSEVGCPYKHKHCKIINKD